MMFPENDFLTEELICNESFQDYCLGKSLENHVLWENWISARPERAADIENAKQLVNILAVKQGSRLEQVKELKSGLLQKASFQHLLTRNDQLKIPVQIRPRFYKYSGIAAAIVFLLGSLFFMLHRNLTVKESQSASASYFASGNQPRKTIVLADGTVITLNKHSEIRLAANFSPAQRELWLSGEAFFEVRHDAAHPFTVHTSWNDIRVLGTSFNVKAYPRTSAIETSLIRGSVQVVSKQHPGYSVLLKPDQKLVYRNLPAGQQADLKKIFAVSVLHGAHPAHSTEETAWVQNRMTIDNEPFAEVAAKLQRWYGIEIVIQDELVKNYRYSGTFENESITKTLEALQVAYPFEFKVEQNRIVINK
ncbi:FecR family protein [Pedobacter cryoconitis]|uniref:Ferric-dicitrate binding protein FerR (Iron transport regulator) n=1 Tax=Pedobacter cryoconitis TaxID=188932 RepID=A0A7X0J724_9SPHI|nr:FecR domain-containing protein [Pedobacter cryoconitis]MBB6502163.1 ferric-dicitrate binding protein FerR (iron transport regulator) [Pedobacter cryoconitis]